MHIDGAVAPETAPKNSHRLLGLLRLQEGLQILSSNDLDALEGGHTSLGPGDDTHCLLGGKT